MFGRFLALVEPFAPRGAPPSALWSFIVHHLRPFRAAIAVSLALSLAGASLEVWLIGYAGRLVDTLAASRPSELWATHGVKLTLVAAVVLIVRPLAKFVREALDDIGLRPNLEIAVAVAAHQSVLRQPVGWFRNSFAARIASQVRAAASGTTGVVYSAVHTLAYVLTYIAASLVLMASIDARLLLPLLVWLGLYLLVMTYVVPRFAGAADRLQEAQAALSGVLADTYGNIDTMKLYAPADGDGESRSRFVALRASLFGLLRLEVSINSAMAFLGSLLLVGITGDAIVLWTGGGAPLGIVAVALALSFQITGMAEWLMDAVSNLFEALGALRQSLTTVAMPPVLSDAPGAPALVSRGGAIRFADVTHRYGNTQGGLDRVSLSIGAGQKVGLVGRSGAGKSTLVNLLMRFFDPEAGWVEIDGQDIARVTQASLRAEIALVPQDAALLHRSVGANLSFGRTDISPEALADAVRKAAADGFIAGLRDQAGRTGYEALVGERGVTLSGGQRQRIALARALLKDAPILILDEATSALDSEVEAAIQETLAEVMAGRTVIAIAHRLSTIARMDRIVVLDAGRVLDAGTHGELLARGGLYAALWARQSAGFIGVAP